MVDEFFFVFAYLSIQFIYQAIYGRIHVFLCRIGVELCANDFYCCFSFMS